MTINNYLQSGNPEYNLEVLSSFKLAEASTCCATEEACKLTPISNFSKETLREGTIHAAASLALSSMVLYPLGSLATCLIGGGVSSGSMLTEGEQCLRKVTALYSDGGVLMTGMITASLAGLAAIGMYTWQSHFYRDRTLQNRFDLLKKEYAGVAKHLIDNFNQAKKTGDSDKLEGLRAKAKLLKANKQLNIAALQEVVHLTQAQANLLTSQVQAIAKGILIS